MLPPGPRYPVPLQTLGWIARPGPFLERCRDRYGDALTLRILNEGHVGRAQDPDTVKQVFTDPARLHAGEANGILRPILGPNSVLRLDDRPHMTQRKLLLPPFHGERMKAYGELMPPPPRRRSPRAPSRPAVDHARAGARGARAGGLRPGGPARGGPSETPAIGSRRA